MQNTKKHLPSAVSAEGVAHELSQLASALEASALPDAKTSGLSSAEEAFNYLHSRCNTSLSEQDLQTFADLSHRYFAKVLLNRAILQGLRSQQPTPVQVIQIDKWLRQYQELGQSVQANLPTAAWVDFCAQASDTLAAKGYLQPEQILPPITETKPTEPKPTPTPTSDTPQDLACQEYEEEFYSGLYDHLSTAGSTRTGRVQETASTKGKVASTAVSVVPVVGPAVAVVIDAAAATGTHRDNSTIARWATPAEREPLARGLARALVEIRRKQLPALKESDFSFIERAQQTWREVQENDVFSWARKLALQDLDLMLGLFIQCKKQRSKEPDEKKRVNANVVILQQAFQNRLATDAQKVEASPPKEAKVVLPPAVCLTLPQTSATANAWQFQQASILAAATLKEDAPRQQIGGEVLTRLQVIGSQQQRTDYWAARCTERLARLTASTAPAWEDVIALWAYMALPNQRDAQQALWQQLSSVWSSHEADDLSRRALKQQVTSITTAADCLVLHTQVMNLIDGLSRLGQYGAAKLQARQYYDSALQAFTQTGAKLKHLQAEAKETEAQNQQRLARCNEWSQQLQSWQKELAGVRGPIAAEEAVGLPPAKMTDAMQQFVHTLQEAWFQGKTLTALEEHYAKQYTLWQQRQRQGLPSSVETFQTLEVGVAQLQRLINIQEAQSTTPAQQEELIAIQQLHQAWEANSESARAQQRALASSSTSSAQISDQPSAVKTAAAPSKLEEKSATVSLVQRLEAELGEPPCGFALLTASIIVTADDKQQPHAAYTTPAEPHCALLITDPTLQDHPYWRAYAQLWQWHQQCQDPLHAAVTSSHVWVATPGTLPQHVLWATCEGNSHVAAVQAARLFTEYQQQCDAHLQATNDKQVSFTHSYGYHGLQALFRRLQPNLPAGSRPQAIVDALLTPLQDFLLHIGLYYGVPAAALTSSAKVLDVLTVQARFSTGFIADLRAALTWTEGQQARITTTAARGGPPLTPAQKRELQQHHQHTVQALWQRCQVTAERALPWSLTSGPAQHFDPLWEQFEDTRAALVQGKVLLTNVVEAKHTVPQQEATLTNADRALDFLVRLIVHRQQFGWTEHQQYLFDLPPACRLPYVEKLAQALPPARQSLVTRLCHAPLPNGRRLAQEIEQREWGKSLQSLWQPAGGAITTDSKSSDVPVQLVRVSQTAGVSSQPWQLEAHTLHPTIARQLFKPNGEWQDKGQHQAGNHRVYPISAGGKAQFWVKVYPEQPASEFLVTELDRRLGVDGTPHMELVKFQHGGKTSAAVITSAVSGVNLQTVVDKVPEQLQQLSLATFVSTLLRVLLTNPEDDKGDDYFLVPQADRTHKLLRIDNERAFFKPNSEQQKLLFKSEHLLVKSIIYCLEQMQWQWTDDAAVAAVIEDFLHLQPVALVSDLLQTADQLHDGWNLLFNDGEITAHFNCKDPWASLPVMCIRNGLARELITRLTTMHTALRMEHNRMTGLQLLKVTQPKLAQYYVASHSSVSSPTQTLLAIPFRAEQKSASPAAESKRRASTGTVREAADHTRVSARFERVAGHLYQKKNKKDSHSGQRSLMPNSVAMQSSLRLESPVDLETLKKVRQKETCSAKQQLDEFNQWQEMQRVRLPNDLMAQKDTAIAEWQGLPLRHQHLIFTQLQTKAKDNQLSVEQKCFILKALAAVVSETAWPQLDFNGFEDTLTDALLEPLLKGANQQLLQLNINGCNQLTDKSFKNLLAHNPHLRRLQAQQVAWITVTLTTLPHLEELDLSGSTVQIVVGEASSLLNLQLKDCSQLQSLGEIGLVQNTPFYTSKLTQLALSGCQNLSQLCIVKELFFDIIAPQLPQIRSTGLKAIALQTEMGWVRMPDSLANRLHERAISYSYSRKLISAPFNKLTDYLIHDRIITSLDLRSNELGDASTQVLATILKTSTTLASLNLSDNQLREAGAQALAEALKTNTTLTSLDLGSNRLGDPGAQALAEALKTNTTITALGLWGNQLGDAGKRSLGVINAYLARNRMQRDPTIATLSLRDNQLCEAGAQTLAEVLRTTTTLTHLDLRYNQLHDAGVQALAEALKTNTTLTSLDLSSNRLGDAGAQALAEVLRTNITLTHLGLRYNQLGDAGAQALAEALKTDTALTTLDLRDNQLLDADVQALAEALKTNTTLTSLDLSNNQLAGKRSLGVINAYLARNRMQRDPTITTMNLSNQLGGAGAQALAEALKTNTTLTSLNLSLNQLGDAGAQAFAEVLKTNTALTNLELGSNEVADVGAQALAEALKTNTTLTSLDLSLNQLGDAGKRSLGVINAYLARNRMQRDPTLAYLHLWNNQLGVAGAQALAEALKANTTLTSLNLSYNQLGDAGTQVLAEALKTNTTLTSLNLSYYNQLGDAGTQALAAALKINTTLTSLDLSDNQLGDVGAQALAEALKTNTTLTSLELKSNQLCDAGAQALAAALKSNITLTNLNLGNNQLGKVGKAAEREIEEYLARNRRLQEAAKATSQPKDSKSAPSSVPPQDKKETKGESKTSASSEAKGVPSKGLSPVETESPAVEFSNVTASSAIVTRQPPPSPRSNPPVLPLEHKVEVETVDALSSSQSFTNLPAPHTQFFSSSALKDEKPSALRIEVQPAGGPPALPRSKPPASPRRNTIGTGAESTLPLSPSFPDLSVPHERSASFSAAEDKKSSALRIEVQLAGGPPALPRSKPPESPRRYTAGGETVTTPPSPQPFAGQSARHGQFFRSPLPRDEKAVMLLTEVQQALDQAHPAGVPRHANTRQAYLLQLAEYQSRPGILNEVESDTLRELLANLQQVAAERSKQPDSPALN